MNTMSVEYRKQSWQAFGLRRPQSTPGEFDRRSGCDPPSCSKSTPASVTHKSPFQKYRHAERKQKTGKETQEEGGGGNWYRAKSRTPSFRTPGWPFVDYPSLECRDNKPGSTLWICRRRSQGIFQNCGHTNSGMAGGGIPESRSGSRCRPERRYSKLVLIPVLFPTQQR